MYSPNPNGCPGVCNFVQDRHDADRYTCLPCGKVRYTSSGSALEVFFAFILAFIVIALLISGCSTTYSDDVAYVERTELE